MSREIAGQNGVVDVHEACFRLGHKISVWAAVRQHQECYPNVRGGLKPKCLLVIGAAVNLDHALDR